MINALIISIFELVSFLQFMHVYLQELFGSLPAITLCIVGSLVIAYYGPFSSPKSLVGTLYVYSRTHFSISNPLAILDPLIASQKPVSILRSDPGLFY